ncbi:MAG: FkbM family methyltransferase [Paludibacteraceae bacterium]|nr:FkbM family methyltransferase [Paludibacteraceae bacterium]MCK9615539.1 FkbM family methyltransferase [Candidatus Omnitrophota bacterium]
MYSQNNEEQIILKCLEDAGSSKFIEIGAYDPFKFSNTRRLVELGWEGVYVEPSTPCYAKFQKEYQNNPKIMLYPFAVGKEKGNVLFYESADAISTTSKPWKELWENGSKSQFIEKRVDVITGEDLYSLCGQGSVFLNIDTEDTNIDVLNSFREETISKFRLICIEHQGKLRYLRTYFKKIGFREVLLNNENFIFQKV